MKEKTERDTGMMYCVLLGMKLKTVADIFNVDAMVVERVSCRMFRRLLPEEESLRYKSAKQIQIEHKERLLQAIDQRDGQSQRN